jgi:hypothetical protein
MLLYKSSKHGPIQYMSTKWSYFWLIHDTMHQGGTTNHGTPSSNNINDRYKSAHMMDHIRQKIIRCTEVDLRCNSTYIYAGMCGASANHVSTL